MSEHIFQTDEIDGVFSVFVAPNIVVSDMIGQREEVVRCRDCAHASPDGLDCDPDELYCVAMDTVMAPDGFCSLGRRKEAQWQSES